MNNKEINFEYTTRPIGKVSEKETHPTGINFTIKLDLENRSKEEISSLIKYISKYGFFQNTLPTNYKRGFAKVDIKQVDNMCSRINTQTKKLKLLYETEAKEELVQLFWDIQILLRTMEDEIEGRREKDSSIIGIDLASGKDEVGYFDE